LRPEGGDGAPVRWGLPLRVGFRLSFVYWVIYILMNGNATIFVALPAIGGPIQNVFSQPGRRLAQWAGQQFFHLNGVAARWHGGGSGDTALDFVRVLCFAVVAAGVALLWCLADRRRPNDRTL